MPLLLVFLPGLPIFALGRVAFVCGLFCSLGSSAYRARLSGRDAVSVDRLISYLPLCGRCGSVGGLRTASACTEFALVVSVGPVVVFLTASDPSDTVLA